MTLATILVQAVLIGTVIIAGWDTIRTAWREAHDDD